MGRWAQRRVGGGSGGAAAPPVNFIVTAEITGVQQATLTYNQTVTVAQFGIGDFTSNPSAQPNVDAADVAPTIITIEFDFPITLDTALTYTGTAPGVVTPQTIIYT